MEALLLRKYASEKRLSAVSLRVKLDAEIAQVLVLTLDLVNLRY